MKLKCVDGKVRRFSVTKQVDFYFTSGGMGMNYTEAACEECGKLFGVHDLRVLKPVFKQHTCPLQVPHD